MDCMPMIFQTPTLTYEERLADYWNFLLESCGPTGVRAKMEDYVEKSVCKNGWKAIWSFVDINSNNQDRFNVLVEIVDVHSETLSAEVNVSKPLITDAQMTWEEMQEMIQSKECNIPLTELMPVYDDSGDFDETAIALEHVRFFYENLWREWDEEDDGDCLYAARNLENRLQLYYDIEQKNLSQDFITQYTETYNDYKQKVADLKKLRKDMATSDSEQELDTSDILILAQKTHLLERIVKSLQAMENPQMRYLFAPLVNRDYSVTMIVASQLTAKMTKELPDETVIEHHMSLEKAIRSCAVNDKILVYGGHYSLDGCFIIKESVKITGIGETIIQSDVYEAFVTSQSPELEMSNIKFIQNAPMSFIFVVEEGKTILSNCEFNCTSYGIHVKKGAELAMQNCKLYGASNAGLTVEENSVVYVERCEISRNGEIERQGGIEITYSETEPATVVLVENKIEENFDYGIKVGDTVHDTEQEVVHGVRLELKRNIIRNNNVSVSSPTETITELRNVYI